MSRLARPLMLVAMLAAMNLAAMAAVAQAHTSHDSASTRHRALGRMAFLATDQPSGQADATVRRLLARERSSIPGQAPAHPRLLLDEQRSSLLNLPNDTSAQAAADAAHRRLLAQERYYSTWGYGGASTPAAPAAPSGQPAWLVIALAVLAAVLALVAGVAVLAARRATRSHHAGQTA
jgi:hypothetical protein